MASKDAATFFGRLAATYDEVRPADENWRDAYEALIEAAGLRGARVLDVGCGTGRLAATLDAEGIARVWGLDVSPEMLAVARAKAPKVGWKEARAEALPFRDGWFDVVVLWLVVHLLDRAAAFAEAARVLVPGGRAAVVTFAPEHFDAFWLNAYFPSLEATDRGRFPTAERLTAELSAAGFDPPAFTRLSRRASLDREAALHRLRARHISTFDLLDEAEIEEGIARAERELPARVEYAVEWLIAVARTRISA